MFLIVPEQKTVGIMHLRTIVAGAAVAGFAVQEHAGQRAQANLGRTFGPLAGEQGAAHVHDRSVARRDDEAIGPGQAGSVHKGIQSDGFGVGCGFDQPEFPKIRKFLPGGQRRVDGQPPAGQTVLGIRGDGPEVGGSQKNSHFVLILSVFDGEMQAKTGEVQGSVAHLGGQRLVSVLEHVRRKRQTGRNGAVHNIEGYQTVIKQAGVEELHFEGQILVPPQGVVRPKTQFAPLVVAQIKQKFGHLAVRIDKGLVRKAPGFVFHVGQAEPGAGNRGGWSRGG